MGNLSPKILRSSQSLYWKSMEQFSWSDRVIYEVLLHRVKEKRNTLRTLKRRKNN